MNVVFSFGNFTKNGESGGRQVLGPGVLFRWSGRQADWYIDRQARHEEVGPNMKVWHIITKNEEGALQYLDGLFEAGKSLNEDQKERLRGFHPDSARIVGDYNALQNNCTTMVEDALTEGGVEFSTKAATPSSLEFMLGDTYRWSQVTGNRTVVPGGSLRLTDAEREYERQHGLGKR